MSQWTHVAAVIRFDALRLPGMPDQTPYLGITCRFDGPEDDWGACDVPCGSEGSLKVHLWENPDNHDMSAYTATIWGDLRDYENVPEILAYLERTSADRMVRQGAATIEVEYRDPVLARYDPETKKWIQERSPATGVTDERGSA